LSEPLTHIEITRIASRPMISPPALVLGVSPKGEYSPAAVSEPSMNTSPWAKLISSMIP
jgi:hypothetical protein